MNQAKQNSFFALKMLLAFPLLILFSVLSVNGAEELKPVQMFAEHFEGVLGTSLDISVYTNESEEVDKAIEEALSEIARLEKILSSYQDNSELMRLNVAGVSTEASAELISVIQSCNDWYQLSAGKFSCRLGKVLSLWNEAERAQIVPERPDIRLVARRANQAEIILSESGKVELDDSIALDPSGLAKGYVIDRALTVLRNKLPQAVAIKVDIGGDAIYWGEPTNQSGWEVSIANPLDIADNTGFISRLRITSMAVAASGHTSRTRTIGHREFSHILTPRDGWPVEKGLTAIVIAPDALTADAVATSLAVQSLSEGVDWVNSLPDVEALVIDPDGRQMHSEHWQDYLDAEYSLNTSSEFNFTLDYVLPGFELANYNRPYVAIWITDTKQKSLKNLLLLGETQRWARENTRWWRRVGRRNPQLLDGVARATRGSGEYTLQWDGIDDFGEQVPVGDYLLHLEASRENGGSSYLSIPFALGGDGQVENIAADGEFGFINLELGN